MLRTNGSIRSPLATSWGVKFLFVALLAGCAAVPQDDPKATVNVYISRALAPQGMVNLAPVYVNGNKVGSLVTGGDTTTKVVPGRLLVASTVGRAVTTAVEGNDYYFEITMPLQWAWGLDGPDFEVKLVKTEKR